MPNFDVKVIGTDVGTWTDPRLSSARVHRYFQVSVAALPVSVQFSAVVNGVTAPLDADLGGHLFTTTIIAWSGLVPFVVSHPVGQSSLITCDLLTSHLGHQEIVVIRDNGGAIFLSFEVE